MEQKINQINEYILELEKQSITLNLVNENLDDLQKVKINEKILVPYGSGLFIEAQLKNNKEILLNVGSDVIVKKDISEAKEFIKNQNKQIQLTINLVERTLQELSLEGQKIQSELKDLISEEQ